MGLDNGEAYQKKIKGLLEEIRYTKEKIKDAEVKIETEEK